MFTIKNYFHPKNARIRILFTFFSIILISSFFFQTPANAQTRDCLSTLVTRVDADYNGPVFLDAYWTDRNASVENELVPTELEVGPDEGQATLAVVFVNRSPLELYAVSGYLRLPDGFKPGGTSAIPEAKSYFAGTISKVINDVSQATYFDTLSEGEVFTLYFDVQITPKAKVGSYMGSAILDYSTPDHVRSCKSALLDVPFILPGKVILDLTTDKKPLTPKVSNTVDLVITNRGSADATGTVISISSIGDTSGGGGGGGSSSTLITEATNTDLVNLGETTFNVGTIPANGSVVISTDLFPEVAAASTVQNLSLEITYSNAYGYKNTDFLTTGLVVDPKPSESPIIVSVDTPHEQPVVTAGKVETIQFEITNSGRDNISDLLVTLSGESTEMKIMGKSKWVIESLPIGTTTNISTDVFASKSLINNPSSFNLDLDYISDGESNLDTSNVGVFVAGSIDLELYDIQVSNIGGEPYVVGSILNQGSTTGKFANIELVSYPKFQPTQTRNLNGTDLPQPPQGQFSSGSGSFNPGSGSVNPEQSGGRFVPPIQGAQNVNQNSGPQYLGDLTDDSSIPFSIPLPYSSIPQGTYPFSFKVTYADDLRAFHEVIFDKEITVNQIQPVQNFGRQAQTNFDFLSPELILIIIVVIAIIIGVSIAFRKRQGKSKTSDELDFLLEDKSGSKLES